MYQKPGVSLSLEKQRGTTDGGVVHQSQALFSQLQSLLGALLLVHRMSGWLRKQMTVSMVSYLCCLRPGPVDSTAFQGVPRVHL